MSIKIYLYGTREFLNDYSKRLDKTDGVQLVGASDEETRILKEIEHSDTDFILYGMDGSASILRVAQQIYMLYPQFINVAVGDAFYLQNNMDQLSQSGIHYSLTTDKNEDAIFDFLSNIKTVEVNRLASLKGASTLSSGSEVFTFYGPKDGLGKTTIVVNTAIALAKMKKKVLVLDFDLQFGDVATFCGIENRETLSELLQEQGNPGIDSIRKYIVYHKTGISVLCAPKKVEYAEKIEASQIERIISSLRTYYDYIFIDTSTSFDDRLLSCCEQSNRIFLFVRADIAVLRNAKQCLDLLESLGQKDKTQLICLDIAKKSGITKADMERVLNTKMFESIPYELQMTTEAINNGTPLIVDYPKESISKLCVSMAKQLAGEEKKQRKGLFKK